MTPAIAFRKLGMTYGRKAVLRAVDLEISPGEIYGLIGANGAGKSTLMRIACGLLTPTSGEAYIDGAPARSDGRVKRQFGYAAQRFGLYPDLTVEENLRFYARCYGLRREILRDAMEYALVTLDLSDIRRDPAHTLSHGWKQRLALAVALVHKPRVLLLDETTAGMDPVARRQLWNLFTDFASCGGAILLATHHMDEAGKCSRVGYLRDGLLALSATPEALLVCPASGGRYDSLADAFAHAPVEAALK